MNRMILLMGLLFVVAGCASSYQPPEVLAADIAGLKGKADRIVATIKWKSSRL